MRIAIPAIAPCGALSPGAAQTAPQISSVTWLAGCLEMRSGSRIVATLARVATTDSVVFAAPEHDFPQRVAHRRLGSDSVLAWVEGTMNGTTRRIEFPYRRVPCPTAP